VRELAPAFSVWRDTLPSPKLRQAGSTPNASRRCPPKYVYRGVFPVRMSGLPPLFAWPKIMPANQYNQAKKIGGLTPTMILSSNDSVFRISRKPGRHGQRRPSVYHRWSDALARERRKQGFLILSIRLAKQRLHK
jgi:hypothetical protein